MAAARTAPSDVQIKGVEPADLDVFYEHQRDPQAVRMASFAARDRTDFLAHWAKIMADPTVVARTVVADERVVGNVVSWEQSGRRFVGYWIGRADWGRGIATRALALLLVQLSARPLYAYVEVHHAGSIRVLEKCGFAPEPSADGRPTLTERDGVEEVLLVLPARPSPAEAADPRSVA